MKTKNRKYRVDNVENKIFLEISKEKITSLQKIMEGYGHLAVVSTVDAREGKVVVHVTPDTREDVLEIIHHLPFVETENIIF